MNESRQTEIKIINIPWGGVNYSFYCCVFLISQLQKKVFTLSCTNFLSLCQNYITRNELLQQKENRMELTFWKCTA